MANLSILGLYQYDNTLFDNMKLPDEINKDHVIYSILSECAEFELLYSDYDFMKFMITLWSEKELDIWRRLYNTTVLDYNPINNYNITETETVSNISSNTKNTTSESINSESKSADSSQTSTGDETRTIDEKVASYDTTVLSDNKSENTSHDVNIENTVNTSEDNKYNENSTTKETGENSENITRSLETSGNDGKSTIQQLIIEERNIANYCVIDFIVNSFKSRFCILVY